MMKFQFIDAIHWVMQDKPKEVNERVIEHFFAKE